MRWPRRLERALAQFENALLAIFGLGLLASAAAQIGFRIAGGGPVWLDPLMRTMTLWLALLGALVATRERRQLHIDALVQRLPTVWGHSARALVAVFTSAVCVLLAWHSYTLVAMEYASGSSAFAGVPSWLAMAILPLAFALMALRALAALAPAADTAGEVR